MLKSIQPARHNDWWEIAKGDPLATFYQTPAWLEIAHCKSDKYKDASLMGELESGVRFVLPLCSYSRIWPLTTVQSVYDGCYGGLIADGPISEEEHLAIWQEIKVSAVNNFALTGVPGSAYKCPRDDFIVDSFASSEISLKDKSFDEVYKGFTKSRKEDFRRGVKHRLQFRPANYQNLTSEFEIFYDLYQETASKRWQGDIVGDLLDESYLKKFQSVVEKYQDHFFLWFVELDGQPISAATAFSWNKRMDGWVMASRPKYFKSQPAVFILTNILRFAVEQGYERFHFGPNGHDQGLIDFKRRFGAETLSYETWFKPSPIQKSLNRILSGFTDFQI